MLMPSQARNLGIPWDGKKLVDVTQWVRANKLKSRLPKVWPTGSRET